MDPKTEAELKTLADKAGRGEALSSNDQADLNRSMNQAGRLGRELRSRAEGRS